MLEPKVLANLHKKLIAKKEELQAELKRVESSIYENTLDQSEEGASDFDAASDVSDQRTLLYEQDLLKSTLSEVEQALVRMANGTYGLSEISGKPIPLARLRAIPWATHLVGEQEDFAQVHSAQPYSSKSFAAFQEIQAPDEAMAID